jgi:hypothetical protein
MEQPQQQKTRERRHATLTIRAATKRRIEEFARLGRWSQTALVDLLLDQYEHELRQATGQPEQTNEPKKKK